MCYVQKIYVCRKINRPAAKITRRSSTNIVKNDSNFIGITCVFKLTKPGIDIGYMTITTDRNDLRILLRPYINDPLGNFTKDQAPRL